MNRNKANESRFFLICGSYPQSTFSVSKFSGLDRISSPYRFDIHVRSDCKDVCSERIVAQPCEFRMMCKGSSHSYRGVVSRFRVVEHRGDQAVYHLRLVPRLFQLGMNFGSRVFQKLSVVEIVRSVVESAGFGEYCSFEIGNQYPQLKYCVQYQETDLNFICRLLELYGIWFFFENSSDSGIPEEKVVFTDQYSRFRLIDHGSIPFVRSSGFSEEALGEFTDSIISFHKESSMLPRNVSVRSYNYRTPERAPEFNQQISEGHCGSVYDYGGAVKGIEEAQFFSQLSAKRFRLSNLSLGGEGNCNAFRAGNQFLLSVTENESDAWRKRGKYLISSVYHEGGFLGENGNPVFTYRNRFSCFDSSEELFLPQKRAFTPRMHGVITAPIEALGESYATVDELGRYRVRMPFDVSGSPAYGASKDIRLSQPSCGADYGFHFPSRQGAEMVLACIDGDPNKPLGLGTVPNASTISPVRKENRHQNMIRTGGGNELLMDDAEGKQKVRMSSSGKQEMVLDDEKKTVSVKTASDCRIVLDDENDRVTVDAGNHHMTMNFKSGECGISITSAKGHTVEINDEKENVTVRTASGNTLKLDDNEKCVLLADSNGMNRVVLDAGGKLLLQSKGEIQISAEKDVSIRGANVHAEAGGSLELNAALDLNIQGSNIKEQASGSHTLNALDFTLKGSAGAKISAATTEIRGDVAVKVSGGTAEVEGKGLAALKGGVVSIN
ncbi:MAG: type VI secretion system Vgr family protein [Chitinispirillaceae bacterium]